MSKPSKYINSKHSFFFWFKVSHISQKFDEVFLPEEEAQKHVYEQCIKLIDSNTAPNETPEYRKLFNGTVKDQLKIAKIFRQKMKILEEMDK